MKYPRIWIAVHGGPLKAARHPDASSVVLAILARSGDYGVQAEVALHLNTPVEILGELSEGTGYQAELDLNLAGNPHTPATGLRKVYGRRKRQGWGLTIPWEEAWALAENPNTPVDILKALVEDNYPEEVWESLHKRVQENIERRGRR